MNQFDICDVDKNTVLHFIGIGGVSMSGLAEIVMKMGFRVTGSDHSVTAITKRLQALGATVFSGHDPSNITNQGLVVYTAAIKADNPELVAARATGIQSMERSVFLGGIMRHFANSIAVAGTHGKTTTTGMLAHIFMAADADPTVSIGGELSLIGGNIRAGQSDYFITEACEYHRSFLEFFPLVPIILNVDADHLDYYKDLDEIIGAFSDFARLAPQNGAVVINADDANTLKAVSGCGRMLLTTSACGRGVYNAKDITFNRFGFPSFDVVCGDEVLCHVSLQVPGMHNVNNALCAFAAAHFFGLSAEVIAQGLADYPGVKRRFERKGQVQGALVLDDYAHHPTEIRATISALKNYPHEKLYLVFQPHTYTRTKALLPEFADALSDGDVQVIITDIYAAREKDTGLVHATDLAESIPGARYIKDFGEIAAYLRKTLQTGDIVVTMGAGNVYEIGETLVK